jgi:hypothetical protein
MPNPGNVQISLMIGPVIPVPVGADVINALQSVTVRRSSGEPSGFQLVFQLSANSPLNPLVLLLAQVGPFIRVVITVIVNGTPSVLMDGVIVHSQMQPDVTTGQATLTLTGADLTAVMGFIDFTGIPYPAMPREARVALIVAKYAMFGMIPLVIPSVVVDVPIPVQNIPVHKGTDLAYVDEMAKEVGYVFYVDPGPAPLTSVAYWGPEIKVGLPQHALNLNMDVQTNVESMSFQFDGGKRVIPSVYIDTVLGAVPVPIPNVNPLIPPLGLLPPFAARTEKLKDTAGMKPAQAVMVGMAKAAESSEVVTGTGSLDVLVYGRPLHSRGLVGVRGAGHAFDGLYFVKEVTHKIKPGEYKQDFTLTRNGLISTVPRVPA